MEIQVAELVNKGMQQDISISKESNEFAYENRNVRLTIQNDNTLLSITNEKGPKIKTSIQGTFLGKCIIGKYLVIFSSNTNGEDYIYRISLLPDGNLENICLFKGNLNFHNAIEAIGYFESENIQKVYWVDGENPTRYINIMNPPKEDFSELYTEFDISPEIYEFPTIKVSKNQNGKGLFPAGTIQYFISYYKKFGASTPIVASSSIQYITREERGAKADETNSCSFEISISNLDQNHYDYIRVYSVIRTSKDGPKEVKIVGDYLINEDTIKIVDTNINQTQLSDTDIYYVGGQYFVASTLDQKDGTVFFGNITIGDNIDYSAIRNELNEWYDSKKLSKYITFKYKSFSTQSKNGIYSWDSQLNKDSKDTLTFKSRELYRFAIQFITKTGEWTPAFFIGDAVNNAAPYKKDGKYYVSYADIEMPEFISEEFKKFKGYRLLIAEANYSNRNIIAQGVINPTVFNYKDRVSNREFAVNSWITRPRNVPEIESTHYVPIINEIQNSSYPSLKDAVNNGVVPYKNLNKAVNYLNVILGEALYGQKVNGSDYYAEDEYNFTVYLIPGDVINGTFRADADYIQKARIETFTNVKTEDVIPKLTELYKTVSSDVPVKDLVPDKTYLLDLLSVNTERESVAYGYAPVRAENKEFNITDCNSNIYVNDGNNSSLIITDEKYNRGCFKVFYNLVSSKSIVRQERGYFVDEQVLTLNSPDLTENSSIIEGLNCNLDIVGIIPITANYSDFKIQTSTNGLSPYASEERSVSLVSDDEGLHPLVSSYLWRDYGWLYAGEPILSKVNMDSSLKFLLYKVYLWNKEGSLSGYSTINSKYKPDIIPAELQRKVFGNFFFSDETIYSKGSISYDSITPVVYQDDEVLRYFNWENTKKLFNGQLNTLITVDGSKEDYYLPEALKENIFGDKDDVFEESKDAFALYDPVRIKYRSTPSIIVSLNDKNILPRLRHESSYNILNKLDLPLDYTYEYPWLNDYQNFSTVINCAGFYYRDFINDTVLNDIAESVKDDLETSKDYVIFILDSPTSPYNYTYSPDTIYYINNGASVTIQWYNALHEEVKLDVKYTDSRNGSINTIPVVIPKGDITPHTVNFSRTSTFYEINGYDNIENIVISEKSNPPFTFEFKYRLCYKLKKDREGQVSITEFRIEDFDDGLFRLDAGINEYALINNKGFISYYKIENNNISIIEEGIKSDSVFQQKLMSLEYSGPYLFIGELSRNATGDVLYGTTIDNLTWNPICDIHSMDKKNLETSYGDTYYQRWDCLRTYPMTEEDSNSIVDIVSFMVESHVNLDCRADVNRGTSILLNARPLNFNLFNPVYNQLNNVFQYTSLDSKYDLNTHSTQITWSLPKVPVDNIDTWTQITLNNSIYLNGTYGPLNELITSNESILAFQDNAIANIQYNVRTMLSTEQNIPIQIANSNKVEGYVYITTNNGCKNKWSICQGSSGIFFIDDNKKSFLNISKEGLKDISTTSYMSKWFRDNLNGVVWNPLNYRGYRVNYDGITKDVYITNEDNCLLYNELLGAFSSFLPYEEIPLFFNLEGNSYILDKAANDNTFIYEMFKGDYNKNYKGINIPYSIHYHVNKEPYVDKIFTNIEYTADVFKYNTDINEEYSALTDNPFTYLDVWNEYQKGSCELKNESYIPSDLKKKFRIWRIAVPRDRNSKYGLDRIRNPWINVKLSSDPKTNTKLVFHNALIKYYK